LIANLRNGVWYAPKFDLKCYFKSTGTVLDHVSA
jgi:hypothetical protein